MNERVEIFYKGRAVPREIGRTIEEVLVVAGFAVTGADNDPVSRTRHVMYERATHPEES